MHSPLPSRSHMFRIGAAALALTAAAGTTAGLALAADGAAPPSAGALQIVLQPQAFHVVDVPPKRSRDGAASPGDATVTVYRVLDAAGEKRLGRAQFVCTATDGGGRHEQCSGTIALPGGQIATQGDAEHVAVVGGSGAYAGARGTATGEDHADRVDVTVRLLP
jgi:hypothetical protein